MDGAEKLDRSLMADEKVILLLYWSQAAPARIVLTHPGIKGAHRLPRLYERLAEFRRAVSSLWMLEA